MLLLIHAYAYQYVLPHIFCGELADVRAGSAATVEKPRAERFGVHGPRGHTVLLVHCKRRGRDQF